MKQGSRHTPETRARISATLRGRRHSPESIARMSEAALARSPLRDLTSEQRRRYRYLTVRGVPRAAALVEVMR